LKVLIRLSTGDHENYSAAFDPGRAATVEAKVPDGSSDTIIGVST
jgi:hypothetical protein